MLHRHIKNWCFSGVGVDTSSEAAHQLQSLFSNPTRSSHSCDQPRRRHLRRRQRATVAASAASDSDGEILTFANSFISGVLGDAVTSYRNQRREELERFEAMLRRAQERFELDAMYFDAEFSRVWKREEREEAEARKTKSEAPLPVNANSLQRWGSFDACGNKQRPLPVAEDSADDRDHVAPFLLVPGGRRASEPTAARRRGSHDVHLPLGASAANNSRLLVRRRSSQVSVSSRELILEWLNRNASAHVHAPLTPQQQRVRTTSSYLEWFVQDLLVEAFNDAFAQLFGDVTSVFDHSGVVTSSSVNQSFASSHATTSADADVCELTVAIPDEASLMTSALDCDVITPGSARTSSPIATRRHLLFAGRRRESASSLLSAKTLSSVEDEHAAHAKLVRTPSCEVKRTQTRTDAGRRFQVR